MLFLRLRKTLYIAAGMACLGLSGCAVYKPFGTPALPHGNEWRALVSKQDKIDTRAQAQNPRWWTVFKDPALDKLVTRALTQSHTLAAANHRFFEAAAQADLAGASLYPQIDATGGVTRLRDAKGASGLDTVRRGGLSATWDLDITGINRHNRNAALAGAEAARAERDRVRINTIADISIAYMRLRGAQEQLQLAQANLAAQQTTLKLTRTQREEGMISDFDLARGEAQDSITRARLPQLETAVKTAINRINILCGDMPGTLDGSLAIIRPIPALPDKTAIAMPMTVLTQRPDIQIAARNLEQAAEVKIATSRLVFPNLSLSGFFGVQKSTLTQGFSPWTLAANSAMPLLDFGRIRARINASSERETASYHDYRQTAITAIAEVEDALTAYINEQKTTAALQNAATQQRRATDLVAERFQLGETDQTGVLLAERDRLDAELGLAQSRTQAAENLVNLYRAMGWGASTTAPDIGKIQTKALQSKEKPAKKVTPRMQPIVE